MKIRNGFVSNSSSSSFVVVCMNLMDRKKRLITKKEENLLAKAGFRKLFCYYASQVANCFEEEETMEKTEKDALADFYNYGYYVTCNQDDIIYFLLKNGIPFEASCHYNHYNVIYSRGEKDFLEVQNYGEQCAMMARRGYKEIFGEYGIDTKSPIKKVNVKEWLKKEEKLGIELDIFGEDDIVGAETKEKK